MNAALVHRGPDEGSVDAFGACVLGHRRLRVIDLATGFQPVASESGDVVAVFNGEVYNFPALREELAANGHEIRGTGDTPVLPHLYEEDGPLFARRLHGMFTFALWDAPRGRLVLGRDRLGKKPLLWTRLPDGSLAFASELKALVRLPELDRDLDLAALDAYLALGYVPGDRTALRSVRRLPPGHVLVFEDGAVTLEPYWRPEARPERLPEEVWLERIRSTVRAAVRKRLVADVPLGALLSGGIDSSIVVAVMAQEASGSVRTFSVGFADPRYDERAHARTVAERWGTRHEELEVEPDAEALLPRLAWALDEPFADSSALPTMIVCEHARRHVTVALAGDGGDEAFGGYERYRAHALAGRLGAVPGPVLRAAAAGLGRLPGGRREPRSTPFRAARFLTAAAAPPAERYGSLMEVFPRALRAELWTPEAAAELGRLRSSGELLGAPRAPGIAGLQLLDLETYLPGDLLYKADIASMACSLELRAPFLDHEVVELGLSLPDSLKWDGGQGKAGLRRAFAAELPAEIAGREKKGFGVPVSRWFRGELRGLAGDVLLDERARARGWFRPDAVRRLLDEHVSGRADHGPRLWSLVVLELWERHYVESTAPASAAEVTLATG